MDRRNFLHAGLRGGLAIVAIPKLTRAHDGLANPSTASPALPQSEVSPDPNSRAALGPSGILTIDGTAAQNPIQLENAKAGTTQWQLSNQASNHEIEGYASLTSVNRGGQISFFVNTAEASYTIEFFRMGWYGNQGGRRMTNAVTVKGTSQPAPVADPATGLLECHWTNPYVLTVPKNNDPTDWASGVYLAKLTAGTSGKQNYIIFVVRDDARASDLLFQSSVATYQAYNEWGGVSLYPKASRGIQQVPEVSFDRPYDNGWGLFYQWERNMVRWLEREGYDVTYCTDVDTHESPGLLLSHQGFLVVGHGEYWSWQMRSNVEAARDHGVSLGFFAANTCYWQIRLGPNAATGAPDRTIIAYKEYALSKDPYATDGDPSNDYLVTTLWRNAPVNRPEDALVGVMYETTPVNGDIVIAGASSWVFTGTGLSNGDRLTGLLGYEVDRMYGNAPPGTVLLAHSPYTLSDGVQRYSDMTVYTTPSGAAVFATGSMQWSWGLDYFATTAHPDLTSPAAQQITRNVLARFAQKFTPTSPISIGGRVVDAWGNGIGGVTVTLAGPLNLTAQTDNNGFYLLSNLNIGNYILTASKAGYVFTPQNQYFSNLSDNRPDANFTALSSAASNLPPYLLTGDNSTQAVALDSVTLVSGPFPVITSDNLSPDRLTRLMLFALYIGLAPGEGSQNLTAQAQDSQQRTYNLPVEYAGRIPNFDWLTQINVEVPKELTGAGDVQVSVSYRGLPSNKVSVSIEN